MTNFHCTKILILFGVLIPCIPAFCEQTQTQIQTPVTPEKTDSLYVSADCYVLKGNGFFGEFMDYVGMDLKLSGCLYGATVGYSTSRIAGGETGFDLSFLSGTTDKSLNYSFEEDDWSDSITYKHYINRVRLSAQYSPDALKFLSFGVEFAYTDTKMSINYKFISNGEYDAFRERYNFDLGGRSFDMLLTTAFRYRDFYLIKNDVRSLSIVPCVKIGAGYALRQSDNGFDYSLYFTSGGEEYSQSGYMSFGDHYADIGVIPEDDFIYGGDASIVAEYRQGKCVVSLITGFRREGDFNNSCNYEQGFYGRLAFRFDM